MTWDASVAASHPWGAKNSSLCSHLISLCHPSPVFKCGGGARNSNTTLLRTQTRGKIKKRRRAVKTRQRSDTRLINWNQIHFKMHVWACLFVCARRKWECACGSVNVKCGATVCILQSAFLTRRTKRAAHPLLLKSQTEHVSLTTAGHGQFLAGYDRAVVSPDINGGSLTVMTGCDGSILEHRREAGVTSWGKGAEQLGICHT